MKTKIALLFVFLSMQIMAQLPTNTLVGYHENWYNIKLSEIHENYNVVCLAFAVPTSGSTSNMKYDVPAGYKGTVQQKKTAFMADIDALHTDGKKVILSIGGATGAVKLDTDNEKNEFISTINAILAEYDYKMDGIDLDFETTSLAFGSSWTISNPAAAQQRVIDAVKSIMSTYKTQTGKKLLLLMAPEVLYVQGGLSNWGVQNANGGAYLPIIDGLREELDVLCTQLYNAGGTNGGAFAWNGKIYYDGTPEFPLAMTETLIKGFTCVGGKGKFNGLPASKLAFAFPASTAPNSAGTGYLSTTDVCNTAKYFKGEIAKPAGYSYTMDEFYPDLKGLMTWSINEDSYATSGVYSFANNYPCSFPASTVGIIEGTIEASQIGIVYPNPSSNQFTWKGGLVACQVFDGKGVLVFEGILSNGKSFGAEWSKGFYSARIMENGNNGIIKLVKI